jgi:hypothetical protein
MHVRVRAPRRVRRRGCGGDDDCGSIGGGDDGYDDHNGVGDVNKCRWLYWWRQCMTIMIVIFHREMITVSKDSDSYNYNVKTTMKLMILRHWERNWEEKIGPGQMVTGNDNANKLNN